MGRAGGRRRVLTSVDLSRRAALGVLAAAGAAAGLPAASARAFVAPAPPPPWAASSVPSLEPAAAGRVWRVGPGGPLPTIAAAARAAADGDVVEIEAGEYRGDVAVWLQKRLTIRGVGGQARIHADGRAAEDKAIWVLRHGQFDIENIDFVGVRVPHRNGAGIRFEAGRLQVCHCLFWDSECGILTGGGPDRGGMTLDVDGCEFGWLGDGQGQSHALYAGEIGRMRVSASYFHHGNVGHLVKSRARVNELRCNRITDEAEGRASYEVDLPNGGLAVLVGNVLQQGPGAENWHLVTFGQEGYRGGPHRLFVASNTLVNDRRAGGRFVRAVPGADEVTLLNNVLCGAGRHDLPGRVSRMNEVSVEREAFLAPDDHDYRLRAGRGWRFVVPQPEVVAGMSLVPSGQYGHPRRVEPLGYRPTRPGALHGP